MPVSIAIGDARWEKLPGLAPLAERAVEAVISHTGQRPETCEVSLFFASDAEAAKINTEWRGKSYPSNVLSFPAPPMPGGGARFLGDIVLAAGTVEREAAEQEKSFESHAMHLIVHGTLHLLGHDHMNDGEAAQMESAEIEILAGLGIPNPYLT